MGCGIDRAAVAVQQRQGCVVHSAELASYLQRAVPVVRSRKPPRPLPRCLFVVGSATDNSLAADLDDRGLRISDRNATA